VQISTKIKRLIFSETHTPTPSLETEAENGGYLSKEPVEALSKSPLTESGTRFASASTTPTKGVAETRRDGASVHINGNASLIAFPHKVGAGNSTGMTEIIWDTGDGSEGEIYVSIDDEPEMLFAIGPDGSKKAEWIVAGSSYDFRLYSGAPEKGLTNQVNVIGLKLRAPQRSESWRGLHAPPLAGLGFPTREPTHRRSRKVAQISADAFRQLQLPEVRYQDRSGAVLVSVCTLNYLHFARTLIASVREHHSPDEVAIYLLVVDWDEREPLHIPDTTLLSGASIGIDLFDYMALKYTAVEMCCACKPYLIRYVMATTGYHKILYLDSDIYVFARLDNLLESLDENRLVVSPHTIAPTPNRDRFYERPSLGDLIAAGTYNAGMFAMTVVPENVEFISQWAELVTSPGAFLNELGLQHEQPFFNWLVSLADDVKVIKDPTYNVAYWNLHDRSLRYTGWDESDEEQDGALSWQVDGKPLVAFHFSGFSFEQPERLSAYDYRYNLYLLPSVTKLLDFYVSKLSDQGADAGRALEYRYGRFSSGLLITPDVRQIFKKYESFLWRDLSPWSEAGEREYARRLFLPIPQTSSLLPIVIYQIYERRNDLKVLYPNAHLKPEGMLEWFSARARIEEPILYEYFNYYRPTIPRIERLQPLLDLQKKYSASFAGFDFPMSRDRTRLITKLSDEGLEPVATELQFVGSEYFVLSSIYVVWKFLEDQPALQAAFPDFLFADAEAFSDWLELHGPNHFLEPELAEIFRQKAEGRSLARIFSFLNRSWEMVSQWPLALVGQNKEACASTLLALLQHNLEFDLDDVVMYLWTMSVKPWAGLPLTFELQVNACRQPSPLLPEGQDALLGPLLAEAPFREALNTYRAQQKTRKLDVFNARRYERRASVMFGWPHSGKDRRLQPGVNFFGYFKSPIGLGSLSRGLALAFRSGGVQVQENIVGNVAMSGDLRPEDFVRTYDYSLDTNLFLSYPHLPERLLTTYPNHVVKERKNIIYLAWEQRDGYPSWEKDYGDFDQVWALSDFAASSFRRYMKRDDVVTVPAVIDFGAFPPAATKSEVGLDPDRFTFLYIFDANSSIERKNPDAVIAAFAQAFSASEKVQLLLKVSNPEALEHREKLRRLGRLAARSGLDIQFLSGNLPYHQLLRLLSAVDSYVSLHRSEGFGYTCAEAMAFAKPVIATNYSATTEFMDSQSAFLVDYCECEVKVADGPFQRGSVWADPGIEHAATLMRQVYLDRQSAQWVGINGKAKVRNLLSAERIGRIAAAALTGGSRRESLLSGEPKVQRSLLSLSEA
jgi:glycosyltransferase involved in cell wall biosynthesis